MATVMRATGGHGESPKARLEGLAEPHLVRNQRAPAALQREDDALALVREHRVVQVRGQPLAHPRVALRGVGLQPDRQRRSDHVAWEAHPRARRRRAASRAASRATP